MIIGGGAAGFFAAANLPYSPHYEVVLLESTREVMKKILISGGGRCNVTHACFDPKLLVKNYPRGESALLSPFYTFQPQQTLDWFAARHVPIVEEEDGRMFPSSNQSETIANTLYQSALKNKVAIHTNEKVTSIKWHTADHITVYSSTLKFESTKVIVAVGSNFPFLKVMEEAGVQLVPPVPSLFTFNVPDKDLTALMGVSFKEVRLSIADTPLKSTGPMLITHWGLSGPAILRLSAWGARILADKQYRFSIKINFTDLTFDQVTQRMQAFKQEHPKKTIGNQPLFNLPKRFWKYLLDQCRISEHVQWANLPKNTMNQLAERITAMVYQVVGKSTFKDEFVTAGGVALSEISFKTFEHKRFPGMYFIGEVLDVDGITGGFNFQHCWTGAWIASQDIVHKMQQKS